MTLNINTGVTPSNISVQTQIQRGIDGDPLNTPTVQGEELGQAYYDYSIEGIVPGCNVSAGGTLALLEAAFISDNTPATITAMATGICNYWATVTTNGTPAHGGTSVQSVTNNAATKITAMSAAITALITTSPAGGIADLYTATEVVVKTIQWTVIELIPAPPGPDVPTPFIETIT